MDSNKPKTLKYNWREVLLCLFAFVAVIVLALALGNRAVAHVPLLSNVVSILAAHVNGIFIYFLALVMAWFGLFTFPEARKHLFAGKDFDEWWMAASPQVRSLVSLVTVAILFVGALIALK